MAKPKVVVLGASTNREKFGNRSVRAHLQEGYDVYPVNPRADVIEGIKCWESVDQIEGPVERVTIYLPAAITLGMVDQIANLQPQEVWLNPGAESEALVAKMKESGLNVIQACSIVELGVNPGEL